MSIEEEALNDILSVVMDENPEEIIPEEVSGVEEVVEPAIDEVAPVIAEEETVTPNELVPSSGSNELMEKLLEQVNGIGENQKQTAEALQNLQTQPQVIEEETPLTEEEQNRLEVMKALGLDTVLEENKALKEQIEKIVAAEEGRAAEKAERVKYEETIQYIQNEAEKFKTEYPNINENDVMAEIGKMPEEYQAQWDTPQGWRMIANLIQSKAEPVQLTPDPITTTSTIVPTSTASQRARAGDKVSDVDLAEELLNLG